MSERTWEPSEHTLKYRVRWRTDKTQHKDFPPTNEGLLKLYNFYMKNFGSLGVFDILGVEILVQCDWSYYSPGSKIWFRLPYALPITGIIGYLVSEGLLPKEGVA